MRLTGIHNNTLGIVSIKEALEQAKELGLDLVEISPNAKPPVCKIMDYGKYLYKKSKSYKEQRKKQKVTHVKEIKFRPSTEHGDYQVKIRKIIHFLKAGDKVKITLRFRGRELAHQDIGLKILYRVKMDLSNISNVEFFPAKIEGRQMIMILSSKK